MQSSTNLTGLNPFHLDAFRGNAFDRGHISQNSLNNMTDLFSDLTAKAPPETTSVTQRATSHKLPCYGIHPAPDPEKCPALATTQLRKNVHAATSIHNYNSASFRGPSLHHHGPKALSTLKIGHTSEAAGAKTMSERQFDAARTRDGFPWVVAHIPIMSTVLKPPPELPLSLARSTPHHHRHRTPATNTSPACPSFSLTRRIPTKLKRMGTDPRRTHDGDVTDLRRNHDGTTTELRRRPESRSGRRN